VRELAACLGYNSPRSAAVLIEELIAAGYLSRRSDGRIQLRRDTDEQSVPTVDVPILGSAPCGTPLFAEENVESYVRVATRLARPPHRYFIVRADGDSMNRAGISDGDLVLVRSTPHAEDGDRVVALVDGMVTIKVLRKGQDAVALEPRSKNPAHRPIYADSELLVQGVVCAALPR
jgi:repressor LexA